MRDRTRGVAEFERRGRRLALALALSFAIHVALVLVVRPDYLAVADQTVDLEVVESSPGAPAPPPLPAAAPPAPAPIAPPPEVAKQDVVALPEEKRPTPTVDAGANDAGRPDAGAVDGAAPDAGSTVLARADGGADAGATGKDGEAKGICLHDLMPFVEEAPTWMMWLSLASFRGTVYEQDLGRTLGAFPIYRRVSEATGLSAGEHVEGLLVTATNAFDADTFRVLATHDLGEEALRAEIDRRQRGVPGFAWQQTERGDEAAVPGLLRWILAGSGRLLAVMAEPRDAHRGSVPAPEAPAATAASPSARSPSPWSRQVTCLVAPPLSRDPTALTPPLGQPVDLLSVARHFLGPDAEGHWPVALLATTEPRALGLGSRQRHLPMAWAVARAYFGEDVRLEGTVRFLGADDAVRAQAERWRTWATQAARDPFLRLAGVTPLLTRLAFEASGPELRLSLKLTPTQAQAALLFLQLEGEAIDRRIQRRTGTGPTS